MTKTSSTNPADNGRRGLKWWEVQQLERQGCTATDWSEISIDGETDLSLLRDVELIGANHIGELNREKYPRCGIRNATLDTCILGAGNRIRNIGAELKNVKTGEEVEIENTGRIEFQPEATCGIGLHVAVLDETGSRPVVIYPGLSSQSAMIMAREPRLAEETIIPQVTTYCDQRPSTCMIGSKARIADCGNLFNVSVGREVRIEGATRLANGSIVNNCAPGRCLARIGAGVDADGFIVEDGVVDAGVLLRNVYVGQGAKLEKGFTAHDSLFFANCTLENGEACAVFGGPYTVSMHKGTLLIGCQTSFMNAGSSTNQSNHMYKLGPVHWGILERGVKTSSNSYLMLGAKIGAFSLLMGQHKTHPNSMEFPFSYLFGDAQGATVVVPAMMLRSCGLMRDQMKWPTRDRRQKRKIEAHDRIIFEVLTPYTVERMMGALETIDQLLKLPADDDRFIRYKGMKISRASLERAIKLYTVAIYKYLLTKFPEGVLPEPDDSYSRLTEEAWVDLSGQIMPRYALEEAIAAESVEEREAVFDKYYEAYPELEKQWIALKFGPEWRKTPEEINALAAEFDHFVETDRENYLESLQAETDMLKL